MRIEISVVAEKDLEALESLSEWLRGQGELQGLTKLQASPPVAGSMGGAWEALIVAVGAGGGLTVLASAIQAWASQSRWSNVRIRIRSFDNYDVEIAADTIRGNQDDLSNAIRNALQGEARDESSES